MNVDVIVARGRNEDLSWMAELRPEYRRFIYEPKDLERDVGREAGMFLQHMIKRMDDLADINVFTQATPVEHCGDFVERVNDIAWLMHGREYMGLSDMRIVFDEVGAPHHPGLPVRAFWKRFWPTRGMPEGWVARVNGMFAVTGRKVRQVGKARLGELLDYVGYAPLTLECYVLERFWGVVFE